jgi:hypothetical protein
MVSPLRKTGASSRGKGYILLEVILAVGIFTLAGMSLVLALNNVADVFVQARTTSEIRSNLETRLSQMRIAPVAPGREKSEPDSQGVVYEQEVALLELVNDDKVILSNLYRMTVTAYWREGKDEMSEKAEVYVYQP